MNELTNKQKFWLSFTTILMIGVFINSVVISLAWVNSPTIWSTYHNIDLKSDEYVASSLQSISKLADVKDINYGDRINCSVQILYWNGTNYEPTGQYQTTDDCYVLRESNN